MEHNRNLADPTTADDPARFEPVPVRARRDGWTPARQTAFISHLRDCRCVLEACRRVGMSSESAYKLFRRPDAHGFRAAWRAALARPGPAVPPPAAPPPCDPPAPRRQARPVPAYSFEAFLRAARVAARRDRPFAPSTSATDGMCQHRQHHQLPDRQLPGAAPTSPVEPAARSDISGLIIREGESG